MLNPEKGQTDKPAAGRYICEYYVVPGSDAFGVTRYRMQRQEEADLSPSQQPPPCLPYGLKVTFRAGSLRCEVCRRRGGGPGG